MSADNAKLIAEIDEHLNPPLGKPTVAELEALMDRGDLELVLNPDGSISAKPKLHDLLTRVRAALSAQSEPESKVLFCPGCGCGEGEYHATNCPVLASENEAMAVDRSKLRHCPKCWTYGHDHRKDCPYVGQGMEHHVAPTP